MCKWVDTVQMDKFNYTYNRQEVMGGGATPPSAGFVRAACPYRGYALTTGSTFDHAIR